MNLRTRLRLFLVALTALAGFGLYTASPASAVCGGGDPGEPCHCPNIEIKGRPLFYC
ncbi:MAG TPA: hypothetical protein VF230_02965 [Acidimicrobiales bacterium]